MIELSLDEIRKIELDMLAEFNDFCVQNNIEYYLSNGTLLGAIKYRGYIPWDDDIDVLVPRADYDRLISLFKDSDRYQLFAFEKNRKYHFPFAKLCDMTTFKREENVINHLKLGVDIDIFPLDAWDDNIVKAEKEVSKIRKNMLCLGLAKREKLGSSHWVKKSIKFAVMTLCKICGGGLFVRKIIQASKRHNKKHSKYCGCKSWCIYGTREIIPAEVFADTVQVEFEGSLFPAPVGYDTYLRSLYGDYEKDPPKEKQKSHHRFRAYRR